MKLAAFDLLQILLAISFTFTDVNGSGSTGNENENTFFKAIKELGQKHANVAESEQQLNGFIAALFEVSQRILSKWKILNCPKNTINLPKTQCQVVRQGQSLYLQGFTFDFEQTYFLQTPFNSIF
jgi:hypothetical protein